MLRNKCRKIYLKINIILNAGGIYGKIGAFITDANTKYCVVHFLVYILGHLKGLSGKGISMEVPPCL